MQRSLAIATAAVAAVAVYFLVVWLSPVQKQGAPIPGSTPAPGGDVRCAGLGFSGLWCRDTYAEDPCNPPLPAGTHGAGIARQDEGSRSLWPTLAPPEPAQLPPAGEVLTMQLDAELRDPRSPIAE